MRRILVDLNVVLDEALAMGWTDFEDAVCAASAKASGCMFIATRDPRGYRRAEVPALAPNEALAVVRSAPA